MGLSIEVGGKPGPKDGEGNPTWISSGVKVPVPRAVIEASQTDEDAVTKWMATDEFKSEAAKALEQAAKDAAPVEGAATTDGEGTGAVPQGRQSRRSRAEG